MGWQGRRAAAGFEILRTVTTGHSAEGPLSAGAQMVAFVAVTDADRARAFYRDTLGLRLVGEDGFALVFEQRGTLLRATLVREATPARYTVLGWEAEDIVATVEALQAAGVRMERFAGMAQDERGVWTSPDGSRVAWFRDPDGNVLSVSQAGAHRE